MCLCLAKLGRNSLTMCKWIYSALLVIAISAWELEGKVIKLTVVFMNTNSY